MIQEISLTSCILNHLTVHTEAMHVALWPYSIFRALAVVLMVNRPNDEITLPLREALTKVSPDEVLHREIYT